MVVKMRSLFLLPLTLLASLVDAVDHEVTVGKDGQLKFVPDTITAAVGDTITYRFFAKVGPFPQPSMS
jgi:plastocyanin